MESRPTNSKQRSSRLTRGVIFRATAIAIGLSPFVGAEVLVRMVGWEPPSEVEDPYIGFDSVRPLFVLDEAGKNYETAQNRLSFFQKVSFKAEKPVDEFRAFALGGSTVWGRPFAKETSFGRWLELSLHAADPSRRWRIVNCGGVSYASYRLVEVLREVLQYEPDLIILYTGHNEFLEDRTYEHVKQTTVPIRRAHAAMSKSRAYMLCRRAWIELRQDESQVTTTPDKNVLPTEVDANLDYWGGLADYHRDEERRQGVIEHFEYNVRRMVMMCREAGTPVLIVNPVANVRDIPPFKSEPDGDLTEAQRARVRELWQNARDLTVKDKGQAIVCLTQALEIDDKQAAIHFHLATLYLLVHQIDDAKRHFFRAKELDICPLRILEPMRDAITKVSQTTDTPMVDLRPVLEAASRHGIVGDDLMTDHVHPRINTHKRIAELLLQELQRLGYVVPEGNWIARRDAAYDEHFKALPVTYFPHGQQRLEALRRWTKGRSPLRPSGSTRSGGDGRRS